VVVVLDVSDEVCNRATVSVALTQTPIVQHIFRRVHNPPGSFQLDGYNFDLAGQLGPDSFVWDVTREDMDFEITFHELDVDLYAPPIQISIWSVSYGLITNVSASSNLPFDRVRYTRMATVLYLQYYRARSEGMRVASRASSGPRTCCDP
jgi:hypothetical protein